MKSKIKIILVVVIIIMLIPIVKFVRAKIGSRQKGPEDVIYVRVQKVSLTDIQKTLEYVGNVKAQDEVMVYPKASGKIIEKVKEDGAGVKKGDVIAFIDRDEVGLTFERAPVESPIDGIVGRVYVDIGSQVTTQTAVALVISMDTMKIDLDIPEIYLPKVFPGQQAHITFDAYPDEVFTGSVTKISPVLNLINRAAPVEIQIDNKDHRLKSNMFARAALILERHEKVPVIIKEAVIGKEPEAYVYVVENNKAVLKKVDLGIRSGENFEVVSGIKAGDLVVVMGQQRLYDNANVHMEIDQ